MILKSLVLQNFRNYSKSEFVFSDKINLIVGPNAVGKTNILEAIYFLASGRSFRVKSVEKEAILYGEEIARVIGEIGWEVRRGSGMGSEDEGKRLEIVLTTGEVGGEKTGKKKYLVNGVAKRQVDFLGNLRAVYFGPEDLELITDSPGLRRRYLDFVLSQVDREYVRALLSYEKGIRQRNKILEDFRKIRIEGCGTVDRRRLYFWDQLIIKNGNIITKKREEFIEFLNNVQCKIYNVQFSIEYDRSTISEERLAKYTNEEIASGVTLVGPHRDDFKFRIMNYELRIKGGEENIERDLAVFGSRGEQRLAILWLKLGESRFILEKTGKQPTILLDDIFSELDVEHRGLVFDLIKDRQSIMTTADLGMIEKKWLDGVKLLDFRDAKL